MGFFKGYKGSLSQNVNNELMPEEGRAEVSIMDNDDLVVNTLEDELDISSEFSKLGGLLEQVASQSAIMKEAKPEEPKAQAQVQALEPEPKPVEEEPEDDVTVDTMWKAQVEEAMAENDEPEEKEERPALEEVSVIAEGTIIEGNIISHGSLDFKGEIRGNIECNDKLIVRGTVIGDVNSFEFFSDTARIEGKVVSKGAVNIGCGSVIIGNIISTSAVIAGAVKGDIDVKGPVVADATAIIMGNIKSRSIQIENGAAIEGFYSQCYNDVNVKSYFESREGNHS